MGSQFKLGEGTKTSRDQVTKTRQGWERKVLPFWTAAFRQQSGLGAKSTKNDRNLLSPWKSLARWQVELKFSPRLSCPAVCLTSNGNLFTQSCLPAYTGPVEEVIISGVERAFVLGSRDVGKDRAWWLLYYGGFSLWQQTLSETMDLGKVDCDSRFLLF